jgi:hypothetical protein
MDQADCQQLELLGADDPAAARLLEEDVGAARAIRYLDHHFPGWRDECLAGGDHGAKRTPCTARYSRRLRIIHRRRRGPGS